MTQIKPTSYRFLIEGSKGAILHTGDFRAEPWFLESLTRNPLLQRYLSPQDQHLPSDAKRPQTHPVSTTLEAIYLDTASTLSNFQIVTKVQPFSLSFKKITFNHFSRIALRRDLLNS